MMTYKELIDEYVNQDVGVDAKVENLTMFASCLLDLLEDIAEDLRKLSSHLPPDIHNLKPMIDAVTSNLNEFVDKWGVDRDVH